MTLWLILGGNGLAWFITARLLFGWWRAGGQVGTKKNRWCPVHEEHGRYGRRANCCFNGNTTSDGEIATFAMLAALAWPLILLTALVRFRPPPTPAEKAARDKERDEELTRVRQHAADLERELGIGASDDPRA